MFGPSVQFYAISITSVIGHALALSARQPAALRIRSKRLAQPEADEECMAVDDWAVGEFAARCAPMEPSQDLGPGQVVSACFRGLQFVDIPTKNAGLERCHAFMTLGARVAVTAVGRQEENRGVDVFIERGQLSPVLRPFFGASRIDLSGNIALYVALRPWPRSLCIDY